MSAATGQSAAHHGLPDRFGRLATDLRVSVTDHCNLRCTYCMPAEGMDWLANRDLLTDDEIIRVIGIGIERLGITKVRFTGGEPLLRPSLENLVAATSTLRRTNGTPPITALTTNGIGLDRRVDGLVEAGLDRVNISLDTVDRERFATISRRDRLADVVTGIDAALAARLLVKINAVPQIDSYRRDIPELLVFCLDRGIELRFIEFMPIGANGWKREATVSADDILTVVRDAGFSITADQAARGSSPAQRWSVSSRHTRPGWLGIIASVTRPFCANCSRTRLTADGQIRNCLFADQEADLRSLLRSGASDDEIIAVWQGEMWCKSAHHGVDNGSFANSRRRMSAIGG